MAKYESSVKTVPYPQERVFEKISDLNNLEHIRDRIPMDRIQDFSFDSDSVGASIAPVGRIELRVVEREAPKCIKFETTQSPLAFNLWIQLLPVDEQTSKMKVTVKADIPLMVSAMVGGPLQEGVEKIADALAQIPYN